jgi:hypothetical protein
LWTAIAFASLLLAGVTARFAWLSWTDREPWFQDSFERDGNGQPRQGAWEAFGGTWQVIDGAMLNISDDRGAKLMNGSPLWHNYSIEADLQLLGEAGDAGFVVRASDEEVGVDAYHGYFAGLRDLDDTLIIGRADYGWNEYQTIPIKSGVQTRTWYHLKLLAWECTLVASATNAEGEITTATLHDPACLDQGRFGLQSYSTAAAWRNVKVRPATESDMEAMLGGPSAAGRDHRNPPGGTPESWSEQRFFEPMQRELRDHKTDLNAVPIASLRLQAPNRSPQVTVDGVVTLVSPELFVQDSTGGIAIPEAHTNTPLQIGDSVEARGNVELHDFSSVLRNADVRLLWSHTPVPPVSVTASQAATGAFDAQYIETEGRLVSSQRVGGEICCAHAGRGKPVFHGHRGKPQPRRNPEYTQERESPAPAGHLCYGSGLCAERDALCAADALNRRRPHDRAAAVVEPAAYCGTHRLPLCGGDRTSGDVHIRQTLTIASGD